MDAGNGGKDVTFLKELVHPLQPATRFSLNNDD